MLHEIAKPVYKERVVLDDPQHTVNREKDKEYLKVFNSFNLNGTVITFYTDSISPDRRKEMMLRVSAEGQGII